MSRFRTYIHNNNNHNCCALCRKSNGNIISLSLSKMWALLRAFYTVRYVAMLMGGYTCTLDKYSVALPYKEGDLMSDSKRPKSTSRISEDTYLIWHSLLHVLNANRKSMKYSYVGNPAAPLDLTCLKSPNQMLYCSSIEMFDTTTFSFV